MELMEDRRAVTVRISQEAHAGFEEFCHRHRVSLPALLEAIGQQLHRREWKRSLEKLVDDAQVIVTMAQEITDERKKRRRD